MEKKCVWLLAMVFGAGLLCSVSPADITTGLVAYWPFDTNYNDLSGFGTPSNATAKGDAGIVVDPVRGHVLSVRANATSQADPWGYVDCGNGSKLDLTTAVTVAFWYKEPVTDPALDNSWRRLVCKGEAGYVVMTASGSAADNQLQFKLNEGGDWTSGSSWTDGEWVHVACTWDAASGKTVYVDGVKDENFDAGSDTEITVNTAHLLIGEIWEALNPTTGVPDSASGSYGRPARGWFDQVCIFDRALSASDVVELMAWATENIAPSVDAGTYYGVVVNTPIVLSKASASDDGKPAPPATVTYLWEKVSGPGSVSFVNATDLNPTATFSAAGKYVIKLTANDSEKTNSSEAEVVVRANNDPLAYWRFENDLTDFVNDFDCSLAGTGDDPNYVPGCVGTKAIELYVADGGKYLTVASEEALDPNLWNLQYEMSVACWVKDASNTAFETIIAKGSNSWRLHYDNNEPYVSFAAIGTSTTWNGVTDADQTVADGYWHHVAGVYDGEKMYVYIDGVEDSSVATTGLMNADQFGPTIGAEINNDSGSVDGPFSGQIDDLRVYLYPLSAAQVSTLAAMAPLVPIVNAGVDQYVVLQVGSTTLEGSVIDDAKPAVATITWTQVSGPGTATFDDDSSETSGVSFDVAGNYVLRLTADDTMATISDEVTIQVVEKTCADVINEGMAIPGDISGASAEPDCYVDLFDFTAMASNWMLCNDPQDSACILPY